MNLIESANLWMDEDYIHEISQAATKKAIDKFVKQGAEEEEAVAVVNKFNELTAKHKLKGINIFGLKFDDLKKEIDKASQTKSRSEKEKIIRDKETEFVFENDLALVISPKSHQSSCKYGANTQWCTTMSDDRYWKQYRQKGDKLYYIIPKDGSDKTAVKVDRRGDMEVYDAEDAEVGTSVLDDILKEYNIDDSIFEEMDDEEWAEINQLTDEELNNYAQRLLDDLDITTAEGKVYDEAVTGLAQQFEQHYEPYSEFDDINVRDMIEHDFNSLSYNVETALEKLEDKYGIEKDSVKNKISVAYDAISDGEDLNNFIDDESYYWSPEEVKERIKNDYYDVINISDMELENFIDLIDFEFDGVLDDTQEEKLKKRLAHEYNKDDDSFQNFYDDFVELSGKYLGAGEEMPKELIAQVKELIDTVSKVEYGKQGHPKLDLESVNKYIDKYFEA